MISVVIPAYNEEASIGRCLESIRLSGEKLKASGRGDTGYEIIVVDARSTDNTSKIAAGYADMIFECDTGSPGPARNIGVSKANGDIIALTDSDTVVDVNWLLRIAEGFDNPSLVGLGGVLRPLDARLLDKIMYKINSDLWYRATAVIGFYQLGTPNCAYRKTAYLDSGGFDESMSMLEDTELSLRMRKYGKMKVDKHMIVYNSARRFRQEGYTRVFRRYIREYYNLFSGKGVKSKHFDTIDHR